MNRDELIEKLADAEHDSWAHWMDYLFSCCTITIGGEGALTIPAGLVQRWKRQAATPYADLSDREQESDRNEVAKILPHIDAYAAATLPAHRAAGRGPGVGGGDA